MTKEKILEKIRKAKEENLTQFYLYSCQIKEIPKELFELKNLIELHLGNNEITEIPKEIGELKNLTIVYLYKNQIIEIPKEIEKLEKLEKLWLHGNKLTSIPESIGNLKNLKKLKLDVNNLSDLPESIGNLENLEILDIQTNNIENIPESITKLKNLKTLNLSDNRLKSLPDNIGYLNNLIELYLEKNQLKVLPESIKELKNLATLNIKENKIYTPPEMEDKSPQELISFTIQEQNENKRPLNEAKVLIVGHGGVGKTSLLKSLYTEKEFNPQEKITDGIVIKKLNFNLKNRGTYRVHFWDFGGQEIMHSTHQFFLTKRSLYILVWDSRAEDDKYYGIVEYWLELIKSFGGDSPVLIVMNKIDEHDKDLDRRWLQEKYPNIKGFYKTSCLTRVGIRELQTAIMREILQLEHIKTKWSESWFNVKENFEKLKEKSDIDYIEYKEYIKMANERGITDEIDQKTLIKFLNDLGVIINFQDDNRLVDLYIINPEWITSAIYKIIKYPKLLKQKGVLDFSDLYRTLFRGKYPADKYMFIIDTMKKFELCFNLVGDKKFLIPEALPFEKPEIDFDKKSSLNFEYHYNFLPSSIISRFIVKAHSMIYDSSYWKNGVLLQKNEDKALIETDYRAKKISIYVSGNSIQSREFLAIIRYFFEEIHNTIKTIEPKALIPMPDDNKAFEEYEFLIKLESEGEKHFYNRVNRKKYLIADVLNNIKVDNSIQNSVNLEMELIKLISEINKSHLENKLEIVEILKNSNDKKGVIDCLGNLMTRGAEVATLAPLIRSFIEKFGN